MTDSRKPYTTPLLQSYGNIRALTQNTFSNGMGDGAMAGAAKT